jgi:hypothetical protein
MPRWRHSLWPTCKVGVGGCRRCFKWLGLVRLPRSSKMPACQQRFELTFAWTGGC